MGEQPLPQRTLSQSRQRRVAAEQRLVRNDAASEHQRPLPRQQHDLADPCAARGAQTEQSGFACERLDPVFLEYLHAKIRPGQIAKAAGQRTFLRQP